MKSGTNWICRLLNSHPDVDCIGEFHWESFFNALQQNASRIAPQRRDNLINTVQPELENMVRRCLESMADAKATWIGDRTPTTLAPVVIPNAPHFVMVRDFRDAIVSRMFHLFNHPRVTQVFANFPELEARRVDFEIDPWFFQKNPHELLVVEDVVRDSAREWLTFLETDRQTQLTNPDLPVMMVRYEDLHEKFSSTVDTIFEFLCLEKPARIPESVTPGHATEDPNNLYRKGQVGDWKNYFSDHAKQWVKQEVGEELIRLGYVESSDW